MVGSSQLKEVLDSIVQGAMEFPDPSVRPYVGGPYITCFSCVHSGSENLFWNFKEVIRVLG